MPKPIRKMFWSRSRCIIADRSRLSCMCFPRICGPWQCQCRKSNKNRDQGGGALCPGCACGRKQGGSPAAERQARSGCVRELRSDFCPTFGRCKRILRSHYAEESERGRKACAQAGARRNAVVETVLLFRPRQVAAGTRFPSDSGIEEGEIP